MKIAVFLRFLQEEKGCEITPIEGRNLSGRGLKIKLKYIAYYLNIYDDGIVSKTQITNCCDKLCISYPDGIT